MKLLKMVCDELGVEIDEEWSGSDGNTYKITNAGELICVEDGECQYRVDSSNLLTGKLKPAWKPNNGDAYYIPKINSDIQKWEYRLWGHNETQDNTAWDRGLVCQTKEEANRLTIKMLRALE